MAAIRRMDILELGNHSQGTWLKKVSKFIQNLILRTASCNVWERVRRKGTRFGLVEISHAPGCCDSDNDVNLIQKMSPAPTDQGQETCIRSTRMLLSFWHSMQSNIVIKGWEFDDWQIQIQIQKGGDRGNYVSESDQ